jgi:hypothetical protein
MMIEVIAVTPVVLVALAAVAFLAARRTSRRANYNPNGIYPLW